MEIFSLGSGDEAKIVATWAFNNLGGNGISVVPVRLARQREKL